MELQAFILENTSQEPNSGCWLWTGAMKGEYGQLGSGLLAHRASYGAFKGTIVNELDHLCRTYSCVNPDHLEDVTHKVNIGRGKSKKVSDKDAIRIREIYAEGKESLRSLGGLFHISHNQVRLILQGRRS